MVIWRGCKHFKVLISLFLRVYPRFSVDVSGICWDIDYSRISLNGILRDNCGRSHGDLVGTRPGEMSESYQDRYVGSGILIGMCVDNLTRMPCWLSWIRCPSARQIKVHSMLPAALVPGGLALTIQTSPPVFSEGFASANGCRLSLDYAEPSLLDNMVLSSMIIAWYDMFNKWLLSVSGIAVDLEFKLKSRCKTW
jgi:hypothetical protein